MTVVASHSEIEASLRLAALGSGWPDSHAHALARATVALEHHGIEAIEAALATMSEPVETLAEPGAGPVARWSRGHAGSLGPAILDLLLTGRKEIRVDSVDAPILLAGYLWLAARRGAVAEARFSDGGWARAGADLEWSDPRPAPGAGVAVVADDRQFARPAPLHGELEVGDGIWQALTAVAERQLVPASERSRLRGAGPDA